MNVKIVRADTPRIIPASTAEAGTIGYIRNHTSKSYNGTLVVIANLYAPTAQALGGNDSWSHEALKSFDIEVLEPGTVVTITI